MVGTHSHLNSSQIIKALGGSTRLAEQLGAKRSAVSNWPSAGIPSKYWPAIVRLAATDPATQEITLDVLERSVSPAERGIAA